MKLLVTGGAGFIGSNFIHYWLKNHPDDFIINLDVLTYAGNLENHKDIESNPKYTFVKGDITDKNIVSKLVSEVDTVVHFAAESHVDRSILDPMPFVQTNIIGTVTLLNAAQEHGKRLHHVSTDEVYGTLRPTDAPFTETTAYDPKSPYSASKAASDHFVRSFFNTYGTQVTISNCSNNYGPYMFPEKIIPLFISNLMEGKKVPVYGDGMQVRDWIHVEDHCRGIEAILLRGKIGETYCLGGGHEITNMELTKTLLRLMNKDESFIEFVKDRPGHDRRYAIDDTKARTELGWKPVVLFEEGLQRMIDWYTNNVDWVNRCKSGEYQKYYEMQYGA